MNAPALAGPPVFDRLALARRVLEAEATALTTVAERLDGTFTALTDLLFRCPGRVAVIGVGKSADVGQKFVGTLNSTGTRAYSLDATRAVHGDLGAIHPDDVALMLSHSGESDELLRLIGPLKTLTSAVAAITSQPHCSLARSVDLALTYGPLSEACPNALAPSSSTTVMMALGDAIAFTLSELRRFGPEDFARFNPAGSLGRKLATVEQYMRKGAELRIAPASDSVRKVFARVRHTGRRTGAVMLTTPDGRLAGLFTDSDLARMFETAPEGAFDLPISGLMVRHPVTVPPTARVVEAIELLKSRKLSELPVVDSEGRPVGMLDITDLIGLVPDGPGLSTRPLLRVVGGEAR
jgi:arabinose-5-phosphate isomerase